MAHFVEFESLQAILNQAGLDGLDLVGWKRARTDNAVQARQNQQMFHPSHFLFEEFGKSGSSMEE